jgi:hypothetical protein
MHKKNLLFFGKVPHPVSAARSLGEVLTLFPNAGEKKGACRVLLVFLPGLRGVAAEVEGGTAFFLEIDFGDGARLADGVGPGFFAQNETVISAVPLRAGAKSIFELAPLK